MLTILDTINDEEIRTPATGTADEQEVSALSTAVNTALEVVTDPGHFITSPTGFPQFVEKTNFVTSGNQVTDYFLGDRTATPCPRSRRPFTSAPTRSSSIPSVQTSSSAGSVRGRRPTPAEP